MNSPQLKVTEQQTDIKSRHKTRNEFSFCDTQRSPRSTYQQYKKQQGSREHMRLARNIYEDLGSVEPRADLQDPVGMTERQVGDPVIGSQIFKENIQHRQRIENIYTKLAGSNAHSQQLEILHNEHRIEVEKLLLEISRLHDVIYDIQRSKKVDIKKLKEEYEHLAYLHLSNLRQSQQSQVHILDTQMKSARTALVEKQEKIDELERLMAKQTKMYCSEIETLKNDLKEVVDRKNYQVIQLQSESEKQMRTLNDRSVETLDEVKSICDKELKKLLKQVNEKEKQLDRLQARSVESSVKHEKTQDRIEREKEEICARMKDVIHRNQQTINKLETDLHQALQHSLQNKDQRQQLHKQVYETQIKHLLEVIKHKNRDLEKLQTYSQTLSSEYRLSRENNEQQLRELHNLFKNQQTKHMQQLEGLKVRMAILHENDIKQLVKLYETKLESVNSELAASEGEIGRLRKYLHEETHNWFQSKKKYEMKISMLNVEVLRMKTGVKDLQRNMNEKLESERSALLLTSRNLIGDVELHSNNAKFSQDQLRKLRQLIDSKTAENAKLQAETEKAYKLLEQELMKVRENLKTQIAEQNRMQSEFYQVLNEKDSEIKKLNTIIHDLMSTTEDKQNEQLAAKQSQLNRLVEKLDSKQEQINQLLHKIDSLQKCLAQIRVQNQQLLLQNQISQEESKNQYSKIAQENLQSLKKFYERRIQVLESDKQQLLRRNRVEADNVVELIRKYNELEKGMDEMMSQAKRKSSLERRIIELGMDENLVKNKAELWL